MAIRRITTMAAAFGILAMAQVFGAEPKVTKISLDKHVGQWAVEQATGRIFASLPDANAVVECDPVSGSVLNRHAVGGAASRLIVKSHWLVAACSNNNTLVLIDLKTNKVSGSVRLGEAGPS